ncbi:MAG TPA: TRAP transporter small permease subunit [Nannocystaceae bacterium]|nr:TRAP transporter small permease subunit [Nannocystaceae bacterium]
MTEHLKRLDRLVYRAERAFVVFALLAMAFAVVLDVVHRSASNDASKLVDAYAKLAKLFTIVIEPDTPARARLEQLTPWLSFAIFTGLGWFGIRTATRPRPMAHARAVAFAAAGVAVCFGLVQLLLRLLPNGLIWSQPFALVLTLWVGFFGASMATYENKHLKVEALERVIPVGLRKWVACASGLVTALVCFALMYLSLRLVLFGYEENVATAGKGGLVQGLDLPKYLAFMALPLAWAVMMVRFLGIAVAAAGGRLQESDPLAGLIDEATRGATAPLNPESDIPTEAVRPIVDPPSSSPRPRAVARPDAASGSISGDAPAAKQSEVVTDRHASTDDKSDKEAT